MTEYTFDGLATFTARVEANSREEAEAAIRDIQALNPDWPVGDEVTITEFSWGKNQRRELDLVHDGADWVSSAIFQMESEEK